MDLAATIQAALQSGRLKIAKLPLAEVLKKELLAFRPKPAAADAPAGREGVSDDLVFALAVGCWLGDRHVPIRWGFYTCSSNYV
jgi:hypothetical protein